MQRKYPAGPMAIPILGNLINVILAGNMVKFIETNRKIYGNVFTIELGGLTRVVISTYDIIHELLVKNADYTSNRTPRSMPSNFRQVALKFPGVFWAPYPEWKTMRSFALTTLREEGMGKTQLEPKIIEEAILYIDHFIEPNVGRPIEMTKSIGYATANIISRMVMGKRFDYNDRTLLTVNEAMDKSVKSNIKASITQNIPLVRFLPGDLTGYKQNQEAGDVMMPTIRGWVEMEAKTMDRNAPKNFIEQALVYTREDENGNEKTCFNEGNTAIATMHLYGAGTETTATALRWVFLYMVLHPDIQEKCRQEIDAQIGQKPVAYRDRVNLPYVESVLLESMRVSNIAPTGLPHTLDKEMIIEGKTIPAGSELLINNTSILHDPVAFPDPLKFDPDRYLFGPDTAKAKALVQPFGMGRRACLGEALAKMEMFIFFTTLLQRYTVSHTDGVKPTLVPNCSIVNTPQPYNIIFNHR